MNEYYMYVQFLPEKEKGFEYHDKNRFNDKKATSIKISRFIH